MKIAIVKYNAGNVQSVIFALKRLGIEPIVTDEAAELQTADKVIFPGVGEASTAMNYLRKQNLDKLIVGLKQPVLGVCLGLQLMCSHSEENNTDCLGVFPNKVKKFEPKLKVPQMGWNNTHHLKGPLFEGMPANPYFYFVHSYYAEVNPYTIATTTYVNDFSAAMNKDNFYAIQAHPEKSGRDGALFLKNFIEL